MNKEFVPAFEYRLIYIFTIKAESHKGLLKIGHTTIRTDEAIDQLSPNCKALNQAARNRIKQYTNTAGIDFVLLHTELATRLSKKNDELVLEVFRDSHVQRVLVNSNFPRKKLKGTTGTEWFEVDLETAKKAIEAVKKGNLNLSGTSDETFTPIIFRPEQDEAINKTLRQFKTGNRMLWNAKMRFGKTLSALEVVKQSQFEKTIIITHRPVVDSGWYEDFKKIFHNKKDYIYGSKNTGYTIDDLLTRKEKFVYFASMQDLRGSDLVGGKFDKNNAVFDTLWDFVIVDEAHEGTTTALGNDVIKAVVKEGKTNTKFLALSGTPFNILGDYDENIYTWDYVMEQSSKYEWDELNLGDSNPYDELPTMKIYTYDLGEIINNKTYTKYEDKAFNFREFFRVWTGDMYIDRVRVPKGKKIGEFVHEQDILSFLNLITKEDSKNQYPYSTEEYRNLFRHSLWMVPGVKEAKALSKLLRQHHVFGSGVFDIVNVAGDGDEEEKSEDALAKVKSAIKSAGSEGYTITLSCGKLTTGVTVPEWTAVFYIAGSFSTSASNYLQTIFRVQSPCNRDGKIKTTAYVFDFAPDRTLKMVSESVAISTKAGKTDSSDRAILGKFLNYCPVIAIDGTGMKEYDTNRLLQQLKRAYAERAVKNGFDDINLYNDELLKLDKIELEKFSKLKGIIGTSKSSHRTNEIEMNRQGFTKEEYEAIKQAQRKPKAQRTEEEEKRLKEINEKRKQARDARSILRGISIRMPLLIYGADVDVDEDITMEKLVEIVDDSSWMEFMPEGVTKKIFQDFIKYYDPEIFVAAGRKIRDVAKGADELSPTERVGKIAEIFMNFKNPDKETVLTPWRVVNMHIGDTLGGYTFYDENYEFNLDVPRYIDNGVVTLETISNINARILEINSKTGLYPLYLTYSLYRKRLEKYSDSELTVELENKLWEETIQENVYVICKTPMAKSITKRTLLGYKEAPLNATYFDDLNNMMRNKSKQFINRVTRPNYWKIKGGGKMKFDAVVGNPPYQENIENRGEQPPVYHLFYDSAMEISDVVTLITPARFLFDAGKTPAAWNEKMLKDEHFRVVTYFESSKEVFENVDIKGGVAITIRDGKRAAGAIGVFIPNPVVKSILEKVRKITKDSMSDIMFSNTSYKYNKSFFEKNPSYAERVSGGSTRYLSSSVFDRFPESFHAVIPKDGEEYVPILGRKDNERVIRYFKREYINPPDNFEKYKVFLASSNGSGEFGEALSEPELGKPMTGATETFVSFGSFGEKLIINGKVDEEADAKAKKEAENLKKYIKCKLTRLLLGTKKVTQGNKNLKVWSNVALQDFSEKSDIDWSLSVEEIDQQLYKKYKLTQDEINFVEEKVVKMS